KCPLDTSPVAASTISWQSFVGTAGTSVTSVTSPSRYSSASLRCCTISRVMVPCLLWRWSQRHFDLPDEACEFLIAAVFRRAPVERAEDVFERVAKEEPLPWMIVELAPLLHEGGTEERQVAVHEAQGLGRLVAPPAVLITG